MEQMYIVLKKIIDDKVIVNISRSELLCTVLEIHKEQSEQNGNESSGRWVAVINIPANEYERYSSYIEGVLLIDDDEDEDAAEYEYDGVTFIRQSLNKFHDFDGELRCVRMVLTQK